MAQDGIFVGGGGAAQDEAQSLQLRFGNRHGLITGATGTGKTVTMQILAEGFSAAGVPVFLADVKGDVSGLSRAGEPKGFIAERAAKIGFDGPDYSARPVVFWDLFGQAGHPIRTTVSEIGPLMLAQMLELTDVQEGVLNVAFHAADDEGLALLDLDDLRAVLVWLDANRADISVRYGNVSSASIGAIQRALLVLQGQGAAGFLGEPALELSDLIATEADGSGRINVLMADRLMTAPRLYSMFLLWLLSELFETLPEIGNPDKPVMAFFFDESHLLFDTAPRALTDRIEQVVRLIRSKGVGVYFVTQAPDDVPGDVLAQLGNRIQHALRAYTPRDAKALKAAAQTFRPNPAFDTETAIREVGTGEAVTSLMEDKAVPGMVERTLIRPPGSRMGPVTAAERAETVAASPLAGKYDTALDRESAHEILAARAEAAAQEAEKAEALAAQTAEIAREFSHARRYDGAARAGGGKPASRRSGKSIGDVLAREAMLEGRRQTRKLVRGMLGSLFKGR